MGFPQNCDLLGVPEQQPSIWPLQGQLVRTLAGGPSLFAVGAQGSRDVAA